jgi:hypothetical protein
MESKNLGLILPTDECHYSADVDRKKLAFYLRKIRYVLITLGWHKNNTKAARCLEFWSIGNAQYKRGNHRSQDKIFTTIGGKDFDAEIELDFLG